MNFLWNGTVACACIYTSRLASLGEYKHTPNKTELKKQKEQKNSTWVKNTNTKASEVGFRAEPLAKTPTFSLTPYS